MNKKVLVYGYGGREHAIAWKLAQSPEVSELVLVPGPSAIVDGIYSNVKVSCWVEKIEFEQLAIRSKAEEIDLAVIGPDNAIADGICDVFRSKGISTFGPSAQSAQIESSKSFAKKIMNLAGVETGKYEAFDSAEEAKRFLIGMNPPYVVKADGLAFGKGVIISETLGEAEKSIETLLKHSGKIIIEEFLHGEELSWMAFCSNEDCSLLEPARDYKRLLDDQKGPNTGGMGCYSPVSDVNHNHFYDRVREDIFLPVLKELKKQNTPFQGLLYAGLMYHAPSDRLTVLEFNARFGDPETQVLLPRMKDDLYLWMKRSAEDDLSDAPSRVQFSDEFGVLIIGAAKGYPDHPEKGVKITGLKPTERYFDKDIKIFLAGVNAKKEVSGGRVLGALGLGCDLEKARENAYQELSEIEFKGMQFRKDIARK